MSRGGYQVPPAQTRPHSGREEGCDFGVFRGHSGSPEKPERGPGLWQCAHPCLWEPRGCRSREQNAQPSRLYVHLISSEHQRCAWLHFCARPVYMWPEASACLQARGRGWCWCLYLCSHLWRGSVCVSTCAGVCIWCFRVYLCVLVRPPVHLPSLDPHPLRPSCLSLVSGGPASSGLQGTAGLCWAPPSTPPPSPSAPAASASLVSLLPFCPLLLCLQPEASLAWLSAPLSGPSAVTQRHQYPRHTHTHTHQVPSSSILHSLALAASQAPDSAHSCPHLCFPGFLLVSVSSGCTSEFSPAKS
ncbi:uncharacterized protein LOC117795219 [Ailuropoda melanoleuca]|uniref:uncharacterized protein LOC117795219 n=1 Tax=Ailuropoda melanoleuca TaxID=9646 RepID=UPI001494C75C|nr:uncharacterized protein LOC117795219 [Ailuropoda melanoleuca]